MNKNQSQSVYFNDGFYYTNIVSDGSSIRQLVERCEAHGLSFTSDAKKMFLGASACATITNGFHRRIIIPSARQFLDGGATECTTSQVMEWADRCDYVRLSFEAALLFCMKVSPLDIRGMGASWAAVSCRIESQNIAPRQDDAAFQDMAIITDGRSVDVMFDDPAAEWLRGFLFPLSGELQDMMEEDEREFSDHSSIQFMRSIVAA